MNPIHIFYTREQKKKGIMTIDKEFFNLNYQDEWNGWQTNKKKKINGHFNLEMRIRDDFWVKH